MDKFVFFHSTAGEEVAIVYKKIIYIKRKDNLTHIYLDNGECIQVREEPRKITTKIEWVEKGMI